MTWYMSNSTHSSTCIIFLQLNTGQLGASNVGRDLKVERAWLQGVTGCDRVVAIVDDGELTLYTHIQFLLPFACSSDNLM